MENERLLTPEERVKLLYGYVAESGEFRDALIKAQDVKTTAALIAWLEEPCINHPFFVKGKTRYHTKRFCPDCWQSLKQSLEAVDIKRIDTEQKFPLGTQVKQNGKTYTYYKQGKESLEAK
jgi:hypothetical protein